MMISRSLPIRCWAAGLLAVAMLPFGDSAGAQNTDAAWAQVLQNATAQGRLNFYSVAPPEQGERLVGAFQKAYPRIKVNLVRGAGDLLPRIAAEIASGADGADVLMFSDPLWLRQNADKLLELNSPAAQRFPAKFWQVPNKAPLVSFPPMGMLVWNTKRIPNGLKTYQDLLNPAYKNLIGTRNDMTAVLAGFLEFQEKTFGADYLRSFGTQRPKYYASVVPLAQAVASGEVWAANISVPSVVSDLIKQGAPIAFTIPSPTFAISWGAGAFVASKRPDAARVFMDFLMSEAGQSALNGAGDGGSPLEVAGALDMSRYSIFDSDKYTAEVREEWRKKFQDYFR